MLLLHCFSGASWSYIMNVKSLTTYMYVNSGGLALFHCSWSWAGAKWLMNIMLSILVRFMYNYKAGGVSHELCVFPTDES